jgi:geranylgeranyl pyrophosphate synthase
MKLDDLSSEEAMKQVQKIFKKRGTKALEMARKEILREKIECKEAKEALTYFMTQYWHDLARPALLSLACEAVGGEPELTNPIAVSMVLISGAIDIHDDIIDQSKRKDGRPTVYGKFGKEIALLVGDALLFQGLTLLDKALDKGVLAQNRPLIIDIIKNMFFEIGDAEAMELPLRGRVDISPDEYLHIVRKKAADVEAHTKISAILGGGSKKEIAALSEYGRLLGMLILLRDDWIDMMDPEETRNRIKRECLPLPLLYTLQTNQKAKINSILKKDKITKKDAETIFEITYKNEGQERFKNLVRDLEEKALKDLERVSYSTDLRLLLKATIPPFKEERSSNPTRI